MTTEKVRERFHAAGAAIDVPAVDPHELLRTATGARRRRRGTTLLAAAAVVAVVGGAATMVWTGDEPADVLSTEDLVPATPGALAAIAAEHLELEPASYSAMSTDELPGVGASVHFAAVDGGFSEGARLSLVVSTRHPDGREACRESDGCARWETEQGEFTLVWEEASRSEDFGLVYVLLQDDGVYRGALINGESITGDPRELDLEVSVEDLTAIVSDPRFGFETTQEMVDAGAELTMDPREEFDGGEDQASASGSESAPPVDVWTPRALAALVADRVDGVVSARESTFIEPDGPTGNALGVRVDVEAVVDLEAYVLSVEDPGADPLACQVETPCSSDGDTTYVWSDDGQSAAIFQSRGGFTVRIYVAGPQLHAVSEGDFGLLPLSEWVELASDPELDLLMDRMWFERGEELEVWREG